MKRKALFMVAAVALLMAACSTETKVLPKKPVITDPLSLQSNQYPQGATAVPLKVTATTKDKKAKLSYQWYSNTENSAKKGTKIAGATDVEYTPSTETIGEFYYYVEVVSTLNKEKAKTSSDVAVITVVDPAEIPQIGTSNGKEGEVESGEDILLEVKLPDSIEELVESGEYEVFYQWYDNGNRNSNVGGTPIEGATESSYMPTKTEAGTTFYYAVVTVKDKESGEVVKTLTTSPQKVTVIVNNVGNVGVNAKVPIIRDSPASSPPYYVGIAAAPLTVTATVSDDGVLSYQWYRNHTETIEEYGVFVGSGGERISGATRASYTPPTDVEGTTSYYVVITNTIEDNQDGGQKTARRTSEVVEVEVKKGIDAKAPVISGQPQSQIYASALAQPSAIGVTATSPDGGNLTYQWYRKLEDSNVGGEPIADATGETFTPPNNGKSLWYYFVEITNTIPENNDGGTKTAKIRSNPAFIGIAITPVTITGLTGKAKVYDGNTDAEVNGTPTLALAQGATGIISGVTVVKGTAQFAQADVGNAIPITLIGWDLDGVNKTDYKLFVPTNLTANITKAPGAAVTKPEVSGEATNNSITVSAVTLVTATGQNIQYNISKASNGTGLSTWQDGVTFTGLSAATNYYVYARSVGTSNYNDGANNVSAAITTANPKVYFETYGGSVIEPVDVVKGAVLVNSKLPDPARDGIPVKDGYLFDYWFKDAAFTQLFDITNSTHTTINDNTTIYAKWVSNAEITSMRNSHDMEWIRSGFYMLGTTAQTRTMVLGYWMGKHEVTQDDWYDLMLYNPSNFKTAVTDEPQTPGKLPVEKVNWYEALVYCNKLSLQEGLSPAYKINNSVYPDQWGEVPDKGRIEYHPYTTSTHYVQQDHPSLPAFDAVQIVPGSNGYRLPTSDQWETACRAGTTTKYSTGDVISNDTGWYTANSGSKTHRVGQKPSLTGNQWGLFDMHGNVREWVFAEGVELSVYNNTSDYYTYYYLQCMPVRGGCFAEAADSLASSYIIGNFKTSPEWIQRGNKSVTIGLRLSRP